MTPINLSSFEACTIPREEYTHRAHLIVAYLYLLQHPLAEATARMRAGIHRFNAAKGVENTPSGGYHETLTIAWMRVLHAAMQSYGPDLTPDAFLDNNPHLLARTLLRVFYSKDHISSPQARAHFVEPDLTPLPA
ncbi:MAG: hypothetical protein JSS51_02700 [Planctomycetes bacterium]|nr:hypothetical protein [Planctomycetota bacterium]